MEAMEAPIRMSSSEGGALTRGRQAAMSSTTSEGALPPLLRDTGAGLGVLGFGAPAGNQQPKAATGTPAQALKFSLHRSQSVPVSGKAERSAKREQRNHPSGELPSSQLVASPVLGYGNEAAEGAIALGGTRTALGASFDNAPRGGPPLMQLGPEHLNDATFDRAWEEAARERRRAGAKPRVKRPRRSPEAHEEHDAEGDHDDDGPGVMMTKKHSIRTSAAALARTAGSLAGIVTYVRSHAPRVSKRKSEVGTVRLPEVAAGFENLGAFVQFHREASADSRSNSKTDLPDAGFQQLGPSARRSEPALLAVPAKPTAGREGGSLERPSSGHSSRRGGGGKSREGSRPVSRQESNSRDTEEPATSRSPSRADTPSGGMMSRAASRAASTMSKTLVDIVNKVNRRTSAESEADKTGPDMEELKRRMEEEQRAEELESTKREFREACRCDDVAFVKRVLAGMGASPEVLKDFPLDAPTGEGVTPLLAAARCGRARLCAALLDGRADPLARDRNPEFFRDGIWPSESNAGSGRSHLPPCAGAMPGMTVVYHMRLMGIFEDVMDLIFPTTRLSVVKAIHGAMLAYYRKAPAVVAASMGNVMLLALLLTHSTVPPPMPPQMDAMTTYWSASRGAGTPVLNERAAVLMMACTHRHWRCAEVVLTAGVSDVSLDSTRDPPGRTALHLASSAGEAQTVRLLLKAGASPTIYSGYGRQPLHDACVSGHVAVARALVDRGADPTAKVTRGKPGIPWLAAEVGLSAVDIAQRRNAEELVTYLRSCHRTRGIPGRSVLK